MGDETRRTTSPAMQAVDPLVRIEAMLEKQNDRSVRMETIIESGADENRREFKSVHAQIGATAGALQKLDARLVDVEREHRRLAKELITAKATSDAASHAAETATRVSQQSLHDIEDATDGMKIHLAKIEADRKADVEAERSRRDASDKARTAAAAVAAEHFTKIYGALDTIGTMQAETSKRSSRERFLMGALIVVLSILGNTILQGMQIMYSPQHQATEVPK